MVIPSMLCFLGFLTVSYRFPWCFRMFPPMFLRFPSVFLLFPRSVSPVSYFKFFIILKHIKVTCFFISILKFKGQARICLRQHRIFAKNMLMICLFYVLKFLKWVQNVSLEAVFSFVSFKAAIQKCSFKQVFLLSCQNP